MQKFLLVCVLVAMVTTQQPCTVRKGYQPLCGTDGRTYINPEALACRNLRNPAGRRGIRTAYEGTCHRADIPKCQYARQAGRVCGSDGITYLNEAMVACKNELLPNQRVNITRRRPC